MHIYSGGDVIQLTIMNFIGLLLFTITAVAFRHFYIKYQWKELTTYKIITIVFIYSSLSGVLIASLLLVITKPFFLDIVLKSSKPENLLHTTIGLMIYLSFTYQIIACGWGFIYTFTIENRRAKETELNNLRLQNSLKEAQITSLTNQLNPHFLFNALNNIRFMIHENPKKADVMITALSDILRYSLESSKHEKVALHHEIEIIERYITIAKIQQEERLDFSIDINNNLHNYLIPPMTLQLLVENAIKHGLDNLQKGGKLQIEGSETVENLIFSVHNDMPAQPQSKQSGTSIGLRNIEQRLHLLYGDKAAMTLTQSPHRFSVQLTIPKEIAQ